MKIIIYFSCYTSPLSLILAAIHTGLLPKNRRLGISDLEPFLNKGREKGRLIFVGLDEENNKIYALIGCGPRELVLSFVKSFFALCRWKNCNYSLIDCSEQGSLLLSVAWFFYHKNIFKFLTGYVIGFKLRSCYSVLSAKVEDVRSCTNLP